jgi:hypothetical protein
MTPRKRIFAIIIGTAFAAAALCLLVRAHQDRDRARAEDGLTGARAARSARIPLVFERNAGQTNSSVRYLSHNGRYSLFLTDDAAVFSMVAGTPHKSAMPDGSAPRDALVRSAVRLKLIGANAHPALAGLDPLAGRVNYLIGKDPAKWHVSIETYGRVRASDVYPGVDIVYYGTPNTLEYDLVAAPGADTSGIKFAIEGDATSVVDGDGNLAIATAAGLMTIHKPLVYQQARDGSRIPVGGQFELAGGERMVRGVPHREVAIRLGAYDHSLPLVIDPAIDQVIYSSYLGGHASSVGSVNLEQFSGITQGQSIPAIADVGLDVALDPSNDAYVTGIAYSNDFPHVGGLPAGDTGANSPPNQNPVSFVSKFDTTQSNAASLIYSTYLGGSGDPTPGDAGNGDGDLAFGIAVDASGQAYVTGQTYSTDFPDTASCGSFGRTNNQGSPSTNVGFVAKLNSSGNGLVYSCYIDGSENATAARVALYPSGCSDNSCKAYVVGSTQSTAGAAPSGDGFPATPNAFLGNLAATGGKSNAFFMVVHEDGQSLDYATYYGAAGNGTNAEAGLGVAVDSSGHGYITGATYSSLLPTQNPAVSTYAGSSNQTSNVFVAEFDPTQSGTSSLLYGTYLGGSGASTTLLFVGTFAVGDVGTGIAIDGGNHIWVTGFTASSDFQVPGTSEPAYQSTNAAEASAGAPATAAFITELDPTQSGLSQVLYSTYFSGFGVFSTLPVGTIAFGDAATDIQVVSGQSGDKVYITGAATSRTEFPRSPNACFPNNKSSGIVVEDIDLPVTAFVSELDPTQPVAANQLVFSTYLGGSGEADAGAGIKVDSNGNIVVAGVTFSTDFPVTPNAFQVVNNAGSPNNKGPKSSTNAFLTVLNPAGNTCPTPFPSPSPTPSASATPTPTPTASATPTPTTGATSTATTGATPTATTRATPTATTGATPTPTAGATPTPISTPTPTPTASPTPTPTPTPVFIPPLTPGGTLSLSPTGISFGKVGTSTSAKQTLKIANSGQGRLFVYVDTSGMPSPPYSFIYSVPLVGQYTIYNIPPNHSLSVTTKFAPGAQAVPQQSFPGQIVVYSGDIHHSMKTVAVSGTGETGTLSVPTALSLTVRHGKKKSANLVIRNTGLGVLHVSLDLSGLGSLFSATPTTSPFTLAHNKTHKLAVRFAPSAAGSFNGTITIKSDDPAHPSVTVMVTGTAT